MPFVTLGHTNNRVGEFQAAVSEAGLSTYLAFFSGNDASVLAQFTERGFNGLTSVVGQLYTTEMAQLVDKLRKGDTDGATAIWNTGLEAGAAMIAEGGAMLQSIEHVLRRRGVTAGYCCLPLQPLTA